MEMDDCIWVEFNQMIQIILTALETTVRKTSSRNMHKLKWVPTHSHFLKPSNTIGLFLAKSIHQFFQREKLIFCAELYFNYMEYKQLFRYQTITAEKD